MKKSTWLHLRIPFSLFLMPVYLFAWSVAPAENGWAVLISFVAIHLFLYPASNGYNSYFDKDEESIGGLEKPPPVSKELFWYAWAFDAIAIALGLCLSWQFALMLLLYGFISKAYSHPAIRLKKYAVGGWLTVGIFQGFFTFYMSFVALTQAAFSTLFSVEIVFPAILSSLLLLGSYPMTQIYQHAEDGRRGDRTLSLLLGVKGTFVFTLVFFLFSGCGFVVYYLNFQPTWFAIAFVISTFPVTTFFLNWMIRAWHDPKMADFTHTMRLNLISSVCFILFFLLTGFFKHYA